MSAHWKSDGVDGWMVVRKRIECAFVKGRRRVHAPLCKVVKDHGASQAVERGREVERDSKRGAASLVGDCPPLEQKVGAEDSGAAVESPTLSREGKVRHEGFNIRCARKGVGEVHRQVEKWAVGENGLS